MERETGIEPATNGLGSRDSTTELLPLVSRLSVSVTLTCHHYHALDVAQAVDLSHVLCHVCATFSRFVEPAH